MGRLHIYALRVTFSIERKRIMDKFKNCGVYEIKNLINGKRYVGSSVNLLSRKFEHFKSLKNNSHHSDHLQKAYNRYGQNNFLFVVIEYINDVNVLRIREQYWIDKLNVCNSKFGYNIALKATAPMFGRKHSEETKLRLSKIRKGRKFTEEHKQKISNKLKGRKRPKEVCQKLSLIRKSKPLSILQRRHLDRINANQRGENNPNAKKVVCLQTRKIYGSIRTASMETGLDYGYIFGVLHSHGVSSF